MVTSPSLNAVPRPLASMPTVSGSLLDQLNEVPAIGWLAASYAVAENCCVPPTVTAAVAGVTATLTTVGGGGGPSLSLQTPKLLADGPLQTPDPSRLSDVTPVTGSTTSVPSSRTPTSTDVMPAAGPSTAVNEPSYDRNSTT